MKSNKNQLTIILLSVMVLGVLWLYYTKSNAAGQQGASVEITGITETSSVDESLILSNDKTYTTAAGSEQPLPEHIQLEVPFISQYPELPTGCEITSLAEVLHFYGYDIDKETLARNYLPMKYERTTGCFVNYFLGSPWSSHGSGCFAPAIADAANAFLSAHEASLKAHTLSYASVNTLLAQVAKGHPVIVWTSFDYDNPDVTYNEIALDNGQTFSWPVNEHCVVLSGYNLEAQTVTVADPAYGIVERPLDDFTYFYQKYFYQAVVIK